jgi:hypothetical protein
MLALGFILITWDHNRTPASAIQAAYVDAAQVLNGFIRARVSALNKDPLSTAEINDLKRDNEEHIRER